MSNSDKVRSSMGYGTSRPPISQTGLSKLVNAIHQAENRTEWEDMTLTDVLLDAIRQAAENRKDGRGSGLIVDDAARKVRAMIMEAITPARRENLVSDHRFTGDGELCSFGQSIRRGAGSDPWTERIDCNKPERDHMYPRQDEDPEPESWRYLPGEWDREMDERMIVGAILRQAMNRL